jgi:nitrile hydratase beta subunit-like protein
VSYAVGDRVRARAGDPDHHTRVPRYVRGHAGEVVTLLGNWALPDASVAGVSQPETCYAVRFAAADLFGSGDHTVTVDLWESYLERA